MILKTVGKIAAAIIMAAVMLALQGIPCAYAADTVPAEGPLLRAMDGEGQTLGSISLSNTASAEQQSAAVAVRGKLFIIMAAILAMLMIGFIVLFNIQRASR